jgi:hypothetical protein
MNRAALLRSALWSLLRNKMRSLLTVLGITIGIAAVICVVAVGEAGQAQVEEQLNNLGDNFVWIEEGGRAVNGVQTGSHGQNTLTLGDAEAIQKQIPLIKAVSPNVDGSVQVIYGNQNWFTRYRGVSPEYFDIKRWVVDQGAAFTHDDVENAANVCAIGRTVRAQLFGAENPIGKVIRVVGLPCKVVATLQPKGLSMSGQDQDDTILLPYSVAQKKLKGNAWLDDILCSAVSQDVVKLAGQEASVLLHHPGAARGEPHAHHPARDRRLDLAAGRRHRHHERDAGLGHGADPRDRGPRRGRRHRGRDPHAVPGGVGDAQPRRRHGGGVAGDRRHVRRGPHARLAHAALATGRSRRRLLLRRGRGVLRLLPRDQGLAPRSDRGAEIGMKRAAWGGRG